MKPLVIFAAAFVLLGTANAAFSQSTDDDLANKVLARVGDEVITAGEFARNLQGRVQQLQASTGKTVKPDLQMRRELMNEMIGNRLLDITARNAGTKVSDEAVEKAFNKGKEIFDSDEAYKNYLSRLKLTEEELKDNIRSRLRVKAYVDQQTGKLTASDDEIKDAYDKLKKAGQMTRKEDTRDIAVMLFRAKGGSDKAWREAEERAKKARARVVKGEKFQDVAREVSEDPNTAERGGVVREVKKDSLNPELRTATDALKPGDISEPVRSVMGWYVIKVLSDHKPGPISLDSVRDEIEQTIIETKRRKKVAEIVKGAQMLIRVELADAPSKPSGSSGSTGSNGTSSVTIPKGFEGSQ